MSKLSELSRKAMEAGRDHTRLFRTGGNHKAALKRWSELSLKWVRLAKTRRELTLAWGNCPSGSEAEALANKKLQATGF